MVNEIKDNGPKRLSSIVVGPVEERFSTGIDGLDACLAETDDTLKGLPYGTSVLLSGMPGGGKSTIATYIAAAQTGREALILHGEERADRVRRRWDRLNLKDADPYLAPLKATEDALDIVRDLNSMPGSKGLGVVIVDSVQTLTLDGKRKYDHQMEGCEMLAGQICSDGGTLILVSHVSKTGKDHAGAAGLAHLVDIHLHLTANAKKSERILEVRKNRMGRAGFQVPLNISLNGLSVGVPAPLGLDGGGAARTALEKAVETAYAILIEGQRLDGYDFDKANCSGGLWRAGLEMAAKRLVRDGFEVVEEKIKGRKGYRLLNAPPKLDGESVIVQNTVTINENNKIVVTEPLVIIPSEPLNSALKDASLNFPEGLIELF